MRLSRGLWPLGLRTRLQTHVRQGERAVIYVPETGRDSEGKHFLAALTVLGSRVPSARHQGARSRLGLQAAQLFDVPIGKPQWFSQPVALIEIKEQLSFI